jgi:hypothetical protein
MSELILEKNLDYNSLFEFKCDFELLRKIIEALVKVSKVSNKKIEDLIERDVEKDKLITNLENKVFLLLKSEEIIQKNSQVNIFYFNNLLNRIY